MNAPKKQIFYKNSANTAPRRLPVRQWIPSVLILMGIFLPALAVQADIYMYIDSDGVLHFTNAPTSGDYKLYIKERPKKEDVTRKYDHLIAEAAKKSGVSFHLLKAVIKAESNFDARAVSSAGAVGLTQIMPQNLKALNINDPFDPWENIWGGARYLREMIDRFEGKLPLALAAYNAGPTLVDFYKAIPPIKETEAYVRKVIKYYYLFKRS